MSESQEYRPKGSSSGWRKKIADVFTGDDPRLGKEFRDENSEERSWGRATKFQNRFNSFDIKTRKHFLKQAKLADQEFAKGRDREEAFHELNQCLESLDSYRINFNGRGEKIIFSQDYLNPQVAWLVDTLFQHIDAATDWFKWYSVVPQKRHDSIRNLFILGYFFGHLDLDSEKGFDNALALAYTIKHESDEGYPDFLKKIAEEVSEKLETPRLRKLKEYWPEYFSYRWVLKARKDGVNENVLDPAIKDKQRRRAGADRRPAPTEAAAGRMDLRQQLRSDAHRSNAEQRRLTHEQMTEELRLSQQYDKSHRAEKANIRDIIRAYSGDDERLFHNGATGEKRWMRYRLLAPQILTTLWQGRAAQFAEADGDEEALNSVFAQVVADIVQILSKYDDTSSDKSILPSSLYGKEFDNLSTIEQAALLIFPAISLSHGEEKHLQPALSIVSKYLYPLLNSYTDRQIFKEFDATGDLKLVAFDPENYEEEVAQAQKILREMGLETGLICEEGDEFQNYYQHRRSLLKDIPKWRAKMISVFEEKNMFQGASSKQLLVGGFFSLLFSGLINATSLDEMEGIFRLSEEGGELSAVIFLLSFFTFFIGGYFTLSSLPRGDREDLQEANLFSEQIHEFMREFNKEKLRRILVLASFVTWGVFSTFQVWQPWAEKAWDTVVELIDKASDGGISDNLAEADFDFAENRTPEAISNKELENVERHYWGDIAISSEFDNPNSDGPQYLGFMPLVEYELDFKSNGDYQSESISQNPNFKGTRTTAPLIFVTEINLGEDQVSYTLPDGREIIDTELGTSLAIKYDDYVGSRIFNIVPAGGNEVENLEIEKIIMLDESLGQGDEYSFQYLEGDTKFANDENPSDKRDLDLSGTFVVFYKLVDETAYSFSSNELDVGRRAWEDSTQQRGEILAVLRQSNPSAAELYQQMVSDFERFWEQYSEELSSGGQPVLEYQGLVISHARAYQEYTQSNHLYSLQYENESPDMLKRSNELNYELMLDVMSDPDAAYYCHVAHLTFQQWFFSVGVPVNGQYGFPIYEDDGEVGSRVAHVVSSVGGIEVDMTPSVKNPDEDFSALAYKPEEKSQINKEQVVTKAFEVLALLTGALGIYTVNEFRKKVKEERGGEEEEVEQVSQFQTSELEYRALTSSVATFLIYLGMLADPDKYEQAQLDNSPLAKTDEQVVDGLLDQVLMSHARAHEYGRYHSHAFRQMHGRVSQLVEDVQDGIKPNLDQIPGLTDKNPDPQKVLELLSLAENRIEGAYQKSIEMIDRDNRIARIELEEIRVEMKEEKKRLDGEQEKYAEINETTTLPAEKFGLTSVLLREKKKEERLLVGKIKRHGHDKKQLKNNQRNLKQIIKLLSKAQQKKEVKANE